MKNQCYFKNTLEHKTEKQEIKNVKLSKLFCMILTIKTEFWDVFVQFECK